MYTHNLDKEHLACYLRFVAKTSEPQWKVNDAILPLLVGLIMVNIQGSTLESYIWIAESSYLSYHPREIHLAQLSLYLH